MLRIYTLFLFSFLYQTAWSQTNFSGIWEGIITTKESDNEFEYQLILTQNGTTVEGTSLARLKGGDQVGSFELVGEIKDDKLYLKDINQISPKDQKWCLKELTLSLSKNTKSTWLGGFWSAKGCSSGLIRLQGKEKPAQFVSSKQDLLVGKWQGAIIENGERHTFEFIFNSDFSGYSIHKQADGSQTIHNLVWKRNGKTLAFQETSLKGKEKNKWQWCLKGGSFYLRERSNKVILEGTWAGFKSTYTLETGECTAGQLYLVKG